MPAPLFDFLTSVSWEQLEVTVIFVLTILAQGNRGMRILHDELAPVMADKLSRFANIPDPGSVCDPNAFRLMLDLVMDRIVCMGPWVVPTTLCYLSAIDMTDLLAHRYQRPIFSTPEKFELVHTMMWNIYRDWQTYRHVLVKNGGRSRLEALELMARTISMGAQSLVDEGLRTLYQLAHETHDRTLIDPPHGSPTCNSAPLHAPRRKNFLSLLPTDIIVGKLMPKVCDVYANDDRYRRRSPATNALPEQLPDLLSPVTVPFSLKSWVLEDHFLHQMYHSADWDDDDEEMQDVNENHAQPQPAETPAPVVAPNPILTGSSGNPAAGGSMPSSNIVPLGAEDGLAAANDNISEQIGDNVDGLDHVEEGNRGGEHAQGLGNIATRMAQSSRALRRRLNERGSFERISGAASGAADEPPPQETG